MGDDGAIQGMQRAQGERGVCCPGGHNDDVDGGRGMSSLGGPFRGCRDLPDDNKEPPPRAPRRHRYLVVAAGMAPPAAANHVGEGRHALAVVGVAPHVGFHPPLMHLGFREVRVWGGGGGGRGQHQRYVAAAPVEQLRTGQALLHYCSICSTEGHVIGRRR